MADQQTVKVRIAVAVDPTGAYSATGYDTMSEKNGFDFITDTLQPGEARYWVTAELPIPAAPEVPGTVENAP